MTLHTFEILDPDQNVVATHEFDSVFSPWLLEGHTSRLIAVDGVPVVAEPPVEPPVVEGARVAGQRSGSVTLGAPVQPSPSVEPSV